MTHTTRYALDADGGPAQGPLYMNSTPDPNNINHKWYLEAHPRIDDRFPIIITSILSRRRALDANGGQGGPYLSDSPSFDNINHRWIVVPRHYPADVEHVTDFEQYCALVTNKPVFIISKVGPCALNVNIGQGSPKLDPIPDWNINVNLESIPDLLLANHIWKLAPISQDDFDLECMITWPG